MTVSPGGQLMRGMTIAVSCRIRYQGPLTLRSEQEPALMLSFADGQPLPSGNTYYQPPSVGDTFQRKTLVRVSTDFEADACNLLQYNLMFHYSMLDTIQCFYFSSSS